MEKQIEKELTLTNDLIENAAKNYLTMRDEPLRVIAAGKDMGSSFEIQ